MNDLFEDQLRADLHAAAGQPAYESIDPADVIGEGTRFVRRRRRLQAVTAVATVAILAVGGVIATDRGHTTTPPPAGPRSTASPSRALLTLSDDGTERFILDRDASSDEVRVIDAAGTDRPVLARLRVPDDGKPLAYTALTVHDSLVGLLPGGSHLLQVSTDGVGEQTGYRSDLQPLGGDLVAFAVHFEQPGRLDSLSRILWADATGSVWDTNTPLPSARFAPPGSPFLPQLVWADVDSRTWGTSDTLGSSLSESPLEDHSYAVSDDVNSQAPDTGRRTYTVTGLLPFAGVSDLQASWATGVTVSSPLQVEELTSGDRTNLTVFHAEVMTDGEAPEALLRSVTFTGRDGQRQSHSYSAGNKG